MATRRGARPGQEAHQGKAPPPPPSPIGRFLTDAASRLLPEAAPEEAAALARGAAGRAAGCGQSGGGGRRAGHKAAEDHTGVMCGGGVK